MQTTTTEIELEELPEMNKTLKGLISTGIPLSSVTFHQAVNDSNNMPQNFFSNKSEKKDRRADMWWTHTCVVIKHAETYIIAPHANVIYSHVKVTEK